MNAQDKEQAIDQEMNSSGAEAQEPSAEQPPLADDAPVVENGAESITDSDEASAEADVDLETELAEANEQVVKLKDAFLRAKAEEDNVRRRAEKEVANSRKFAIEGFAKEMLQVRDSLMLACSVALPDEADEAVKSTREGVEITLKQLDSALAKFSVVEIASEVGAKPDPNLHQAMSIVDAPDAESGCIINVIQAGFQLHDRLLRPAMVVVAK